MGSKVHRQHDQLTPDPRFGSKLASKFINCLMWRRQEGDRHAGLLRRHGPDQEAACRTPTRSRSSPRRSRTSSRSIEVRSQRVGGATYQVPMQVNEAPAEPGDPLDPRRHPREEPAGRCTSGSPTS